MSFLANTTPILFEGTPQKIRIVSNCICYGPCHVPDDIVEQHITINTQGRVWYSSYKFRDGKEKYEKAETRNFKIDKELANKILNTVISYFTNICYIYIYITDVGSWNMKITNTENMAFDFSGCLCGNYEFDGNDVCNLIRDTLEMEELFFLMVYNITTSDKSIT